MSHEDNSIQFIKEVEKREYLYNFNMPEYGRKDLTEKGWAEIGRITGYSINECKEKWRNIRSSFLRSLKSVDGKTKRRYYLHDELQFLLPYRRLQQSDQSTINSELSENQNTVDLKIEYAEDSNDLSDDNLPPYHVVSDNHNSMIDSSAADQQTYAIESNGGSNHHRRRRKRDRSELVDSFVDYLAYKRQKASTSTSIQPSYSPIEHFFQSLIPDIESMSEEQVRRFKIKVLFLIDKIKSNNEE